MLTNQMPVVGLLFFDAIYEETLGLDARKVSLARTQQLLLVAKLLQNHRVSVIYGEKPSLRGESK